MGEPKEREKPCKRADECCMYKPCQHSKLKELKKAEKKKAKKARKDKKDKKDKKKKG